MADACDSAAVPGGDVAPPTPYLFQCKHAINPHMRRIIDRHQSFTEYCPSHRVEADFVLKLMEEPDVIFKAKLTMKRAKEILDEVKCMKCKKEERCMVYLPCAHITECFCHSRKSQLCKLCGKFI